ncbi:DUF1850 domain-containing protein [Sporosarcina sp. G11-34]|uniref:DUF1850 domain-containing protein n=1 Tax=Sporosarcina sp. G11-34 TaxID=2849605 RepID=UPI0022A908D1|nr:DUF1850 domain-containing protein [Sporosarcina sp. G11-34]MCZ2257388.1 DUF1850 domain-containing protein [Sporosarcina sp. G11-34]
MKKFIIIMLFLLVGTGTFIIPVQSGFLLTINEKETVLFVPNKTKEMTVGWRHSVELTPWEETYQVIEKGNLSLESTIYMSYGAGTPDTEGVVELLPNGFMRVTGIERIIPSYSLMYIPISQYYVKINNKKYILSDFVPEYENVKIHYKVLRLHDWIYLKFKGRG